MKYGLTGGGQSSGTPDSKWGIDYYNIDCNKVFDAGNASSVVGLTIQYTQNTHISALEMAKAYKLKPGETLYCWVNTHVKSDQWLGRVYLGSITMNKRGQILYKDSLGTKRECTSAFANISGKQTGRYMLIKDSNGTQRLIDIYSSLY